MKRLKKHEKQLEESGSYTHVCIAKVDNGGMCWHMLKLQRTADGGFVTSKAVSYVSDCHPKHPSAVARKKPVAARDEKMEATLQGEGVHVASKKASSLRSDLNLTWPLAIIVRLSDLT